VVTLGLVLFFWVADSLVDHLVFEEGSFLECALRPDPKELWMRTLTCLLVGFLCAFAMHARALIGRLRAVNVELEEARVNAEIGNRAKTEFLANMSHEIRTPMTSVLGFADTLAEGPLSETETRQAVQTIQKSGRHLLSIINNILDLSRTEGLDRPAEGSVISPQGIVEEVRSIMSVRAEQRGLNLEAEFEGVVPEAIRSDPTRIRQILINLIGNAIKFTERGEVRLVSRFVSQGEPKMEFEVVDTGIGIPEGHAEEVFEAFAQVDRSMSRRFSGTGLGLTISKRLAESLGGDVVLVESREGSGSRFRATVGVEVVLGAVDAEAPREALHRHPVVGRVLVAEDVPDSRLVIRRMLERVGLVVEEVANGRLAVERAEEAAELSEPFDVILMDLQMPELDGYEATRTLRSRGYAHPIIAVTAHTMAGDMEKCIAAGCDDYLSKPIDREKLVDLVGAYVQKSQET
jgi:two-component system CheB/CheR fusion protein